MNVFMKELFETMGRTPERVQLQAGYERIYHGLKIAGTLLLGENSLPIDEWDKWTLPGRRKMCESRWLQCGSRQCLACFRKWAYAKARKDAAIMLEVAKAEKMKLNHGIWDLQQCRRKAIYKPRELYDIMKEYHVGKGRLGAGFVFHPYRVNRDMEKMFRVWKWSPHYHLISNFEYEKNDEEFLKEQAKDRKIFINITRKYAGQKNPVTGNINKRYLDPKQDKDQVIEIISYELSHSGLKYDRRMHSHSLQGAFVKRTSGLYTMAEAAKEYKFGNDGSVRLEKKYVAKKWPTWEEVWEKLKRKNGE